MVDNLVTRGQNTISGNVKLQAFLITSLLFLISYITVGWWTDSYQNMFDSAISGDFTANYLPAAHNTFPEYMPGAAWIFNRLTIVCPIRWIALFFQGVLFVSICVLYYQALSFIRYFPLISKGLFLIFISILFFESVVLYHMVRVTMFAGIAALSFLIVEEENKYFSKKIAPYFLLFIIALWIRSNVHLFILVFISGAFLIHKKSLKPLLVFWLAFFAFFLFYYKIVFWTDYSNDLNSFFLYNTEFKLYHTGKYMSDLKLTELLDSIKYRAIQNDILGDEKNLGVDFYKRINAFGGFDRISYSQAIYAYQNFVQIVLDNIHFIIADILLIIFYLTLGGSSLKNYRLKTIGLFVFFYLIIFSLCFIKMENRFLVPFQVLFLFSISILHKPKLFFEKNSSIYFFVFVLLILIISAKYIGNKIEKEKIETNNFKNGFDWLSRKFANDVLIINNGFITRNLPFENFYQIRQFKKLYIFNYYATQFSPVYRPYLEKECKCDIGTFDGFYDALLKENDRIVVLDNPDRLMVLLEYMQKVYGKKYIVKKVPFAESEYAFMGFGYKLEPFLMMKYQ